MTNCKHTCLVLTCTQIKLYVDYPVVPHCREKTFNGTTIRKRLSFGWVSIAYYVMFDVSFLSEDLFVDFYECVHVGVGLFVSQDNNLLHDQSCRLASLESTCTTAFHTQLQCIQSRE